MRPPFFVFPLPRNTQTGREPSRMGLISPPLQGPLSSFYSSLSADRAKTAAF